MCSGKEPATCDDKGVIDCFPMNCRTAPDISCPDSTSCSNQGPCAAGAACCGGNCSDISSYINSCTTATQLQAKPGEAKCGTLICCMEGATFELSETQKGNRSAWYHGKATWSSGCPCNFCLIGKCDEYIVNHHQIVFTAPAGAYYKVRLYFGNPGYNGCNEKPITEIPVGNGDKSTMYVSRNVYMSDSDKSMDYWIEIVYDHGATCGQWQLDTYWSNCKY
jgi:hypothetical protein